MVCDTLSNGLSCRNPFERDLLPWRIVERKSSFFKTKKKKENKTTNKEKRHFLQEHHLYLANYFVNGGAREQDQTLLYQYIRINQNSIWWMLGIFEMLHCFASDALINNQKVKLTGVWCILIQYWSMKDLYTCLCSSLRVVQSASAAVPGKVNDRAMSVQD